MSRTGFANMKTTKLWSTLGLVSALLIGVLAMTTNAGASAIPAGWTCTGSCGSLGANGVVPLSPTGNSSYQYVTTNGGTGGVGVLPSGPLGSETNGSTLATSVFTVTAGTDLNFYFDFVTSDGAGYADYAWAELFNSSNSPVALLFTARTVPSGSIVPGTGMPAPTATLNPASVPIQSGTTWSPLGGYSGACYNSGCGNTGWINSDYTIAAAGSYYLEIGVTNWIDTLYDTGLAMDGVTVGGTPINSPIPEPSSIVLLLTGLCGGAVLLRRRVMA
jgi:hypothetical protein